MAGPGAGKSVGKVSVRAVPDTSRFREELAAQLKREVAGFSVKVPVSVDTSQLGVLKKQIASAVTSVDKLDFSKAFNFDMSPLETAIGNITARIHQMQEGLKKVIPAAKEMTIRFRDSLNVVGKMRKYWANVRDEAGSTGKTVTRVLSVRAFSSIIGGLKGVGRGFKSLGRDANKGLRGLGSVLGSVSSGLGNLSSSALKAAASLIPTSRSGMILFAVLAGGAPIVGLIAGLLAGLPSLIMAVAAPIAALALGFEGIKAAAGSLSDEVASLKSSLSATFEKGMTPVFEQLQSIFPVLERGLDAVAVGTIAWAQAFTDVVTSSKGSAQLETILTNVGSLMEQMTPFVSNFTQAFLTMAEQGSNQFGLLAGVMNDFATSFNSMIERTIATGTFAGAISGLAAVTDSLLQLFVRLMDAGMQVMAQVGGPLSTMIDAFGSALVAVMPILGSITTLIATVLTPVFDILASVFNTLAPVIQAFAELFGGVLAEALGILAPILQDVATVVADVLLTAFEALAPVFDALMPVLAQVAEIFGTVFLKVFEALAPILQPLMDAFTQIALVFISLLVPALELIMPFVELLIGFLAQVVQALIPLFPSIVALAKSIGAVLLDALIMIMPIIMEVAQLVLPFLLSAIEKLIPFVSQLIEGIAKILPPVLEVIGAIMEALIPAFQAIMDIVGPIFDAILSIIDSVLGVIMGIIKTFAGLLTGNWEAAWNGLKEVFSNAWEAVKTAIKLGIDGVIWFFTELPGKILSALGNLIGLLVDVGGDILQGLINGLKQMASKVIDFFKNLISDAVGAVLDWLGIGSPSKVFHQIGVWTGQGLVNGLDKMHNPVVAQSQKMAAAVTDAFAGTENIGTEWARSIESGLPTAVKAIDKFTSQAQKSAQAEFAGQLTADGGIASIGDQIAAGMEGMEVKMDSKPVGTIINKRNLANRRRG